MSSSTTFTVRPATLRDAKTIAEIHHTSINASYRSLLSTVASPLGTLEGRVTFWRDAIEFCEPQVMVALEKDKIVGFVGFDRCRDPKTPATMGEIWDIHVQASRIGLGAGLALWDAAREGLLEEGCTHVCVWIPLANERALRFHEIAGFKREMSTAKTVDVDKVKIEEIRLKRPLA